MPESELNRDEQIVEKALDYASKSKLDNNDVLSACVAVAIILVIIAVCVICIVLRNKRYKKEIAEDLAMKKELDEVSQKDKPAEQSIKAEENSGSEQPQQKVDAPESEVSVQQNEQEQTKSEQTVGVEDSQKTMQSLSKEENAQNVEATISEQQQNVSSVNPALSGVAINPIQPAQQPTMKSAQTQQQGESQEQKTKAWPGKV